jgi:glycosyltransferase involved in cell wall biosynthesis
VNLTKLEKKDSLKFRNTTDRDLRFSFVIPAHNEEFALPACLNSIHRTAQSLALDYEVIVVDDDSQDRTSEIAREHGAKVERVQLRKIGAVRNAGAIKATGDVFVFVDADTCIDQKTVAGVRAAISAGWQGGGAAVRFDRPINLFPLFLAHSFELLWVHWLKLAAGCFVWVRADTFRKIGGFDERYFAAEEMYLSLAIKRHGRFKIIRNPVLTSARKLRFYSLPKLLSIIIVPLILGPLAWRSSRWLSILYQTQRETTSDPVGHAAEAEKEMTPSHGDTIATQRGSGD